MRFFPENLATFEQKKCCSKIWIQTLTSEARVLNPKAYGGQGHSPGRRCGVRSPPNIKKNLNFSTKLTISQKLKLGKILILIFHSFQHIAHLSRELSHFWMILVSDTLEKPGVSSHRKL